MFGIMLLKIQNFEQIRIFRQTHPVFIGALHGPQTFGSGLFSVGLMRLYQAFEGEVGSENQILD